MRRTIAMAISLTDGTVPQFIGRQSQGPEGVDRAPHERPLPLRVTWSRGSKWRSERSGLRPTRLGRLFAHSLHRRVCVWPKLKRVRLDCLTKMVRPFWPYALGAAIAFSLLGADGHEACCGAWRGGVGFLSLPSPSIRGPRGARHRAITIHCLQRIEDGFGLPRLANAKDAATFFDLLPDFVPMSGQVVPLYPKSQAKGVN